MAIKCIMFVKTEKIKLATLMAKQGDDYKLSI